MDNWIWNASPVDQYIYFNKMVVKEGSVWILTENKDFVQLAPNSFRTDKKFGLAVYPSKELGEVVCQKEGYTDCTVEEIELKEFLYTWCFRLIEDGGFIVLFFDGEKGYVDDRLEEFINDIEVTSRDIIPENALPFTEFEEEEEEEDCPPLNEYIFNNMMKASEQKRYKYFIGHVTQWQKVWVLMQNEDDIVCLQDNEGFIGMGVWPYKDYVEYVQRDPEFCNCTVSSIEVHDFIDAYIPHLKKDDTKIALFYNGKDFVCISDLDQFEKDMREELERIE